MRIAGVVVVLLAVVRLAGAQSYQEKKDNDAIGVIERSLAKIDRIPTLFDGTRIPDGADLGSVSGLLDQLTLHLRASTSAFGDLSPAAARRPDVQKLRAKFDDLVRYRDALAPAFAAASRGADDAARTRKADDQRARDTARPICAEYRAELQKTGDHERMELFTQLADGGALFWQTVEDGAQYKAALERTRALCKRLKDPAAACTLVSNVPPRDTRFCEVAAKGDALVKDAMKHLVAHWVTVMGPTRITTTFDSRQGWLDVDGVVGWTAYFTGAKLRELVTQKVVPLLAQAGIADTERDALFATFATAYAALEAKVRETAATWPLPGAPCTGPGCAQAKKLVARWYRGAAIKRFQHTAPGWKILTNPLSIPTHRERYGFALVQVKGEPLCQLRMWTLSEQYAGGGRYTAARDVLLHAVRWQACS